MTPAVRSMVGATYVRDIDTSRAFYELLGFHQQSAGKAATSAWSALHHNGPSVLLASTQPPLGIPRLPGRQPSRDAVRGEGRGKARRYRRGQGVGVPYPRRRDPHDRGRGIHRNRKRSGNRGVPVPPGRLVRGAWRRSLTWRRRSLAWLRRDIHGYRVSAAHLSQRIKVTAAADGLCRIGAEQRERVLAAQLVPHRLDLDGRIDQPVIPEQRDHLAINADRLPGPRLLPDQRADGQPEAGRIGPVSDDEPAHRLAGVEREVGAAHLGCRYVDARLSEPSLEQEPVSRRGDHDRRAAFLDGFEKVLAHPPGEPVIVLVEQNDMITGTSAEDISPRSHGVPIQERRISALQGSSWPLRYLGGGPALHR